MAMACLKTRVFRFSGIPAAVSKPHFLDADPSLLQHVDGLQPNETLHGTSLAIQPVRKKLSVENIAVFGWTKPGIADGVRNQSLSLTGSRSLIRTAFPGFDAAFSRKEYLVKGEERKEDG